MTTNPTPGLGGNQPPAPAEPPTVKDRIGQAGKALAGALGGALISILFTTVTEPDAALNPDAVPGADQFVQLPNTSAEWITFAVAVVLGFLLPWAKRNYPSVTQALETARVAQARVAEGKQSV